MITLEEYYVNFMNGISHGADANDDFKQSQFFEKTIEYLMEEGVVEDFVYCPYQNKISGFKIDGYHLIEDRNILTLFICDFEDSESPNSLTQSDITTNLKRMEKFFTESLKREFYLKLEETSEGYQAAEFIYSHQNNFNELKIILMSNKYLSSRVKDLKGKDIKHYNVSYDVWDINRFFQAESTKGETEAIEIDFINEFGYGISSLPASFKNDTYKSFLCVVQGEILATLYEKYGSRLLEANIRSFLQFKSSINKGLRSTIKDSPEMFFAYNNGITATAEDITRNENGQITHLKNLQIVNGGQTTASLYATRKNDKANLENIFVQMKLSIIPAEIINEVVPKIAKYANTQNKVSESDFFSNHEFHRRMEEKSRRIWAPKQQNSLKQTKWFYERAKGQYLEEQSKLTESKKREFKEIYPKNQMFAKTDLAKIMITFEKNPNHAVKGAQIAFKFFADKVVKTWETNDEFYSDVFYKHTIAKMIIFKETQKMIAAHKEFRGQDRAIIVAYTIYAVVSLATKLDLFIDYLKVWEKQEIDIFFSQQIINLATKVNQFMFSKTESNGMTILSYSKTDTCLKNLQEILEKETLQLNEDFIETLVDRQEIQSEIKEGKSDEKIKKDIELTKKLFKLKLETWKNAINFGQEKRLLVPDEISFLNIIPNMLATGKRPPSDKQQKRIVEILQKLEEEGFSLDT